MFYVGYPNNERPVSQALLDKNIHYLKAEPSDVCVIVDLLEPQDYYTQFVFAISAYMRAYETGVECTVSDRYYLTKFASVIPLDTPEIGFCYNTPPPEALKEIVTGLSTRVIRLFQKEVHIGQCNHESIVTLCTYAAVNHKCKVPANVMNLDGYKIYRFISKIFTLFLHTVRYAAYNTEAATTMITPNNDFSMNMEETSSTSILEKRYYHN
jgi:hypothetical protein